MSTECQLCAGHEFSVLYPLSHEISTVSRRILASLWTTWCTFPSEVDRCHLAPSGVRFSPKTLHCTNLDLWALQFFLIWNSLLILLNVWLIIITQRFCMCKFTYLLKCIFNSPNQSIFVALLWSFVNTCKDMRSPVLVNSAEREQGDTVPCFSSHSVNKCPFCDVCTWC